MNVPVARRFEILAAGLEMLADSVSIFEADAASLGGTRRDRGAAVLRCFADEEAAKVLIVLDMARAGWSDQITIGSLLKAFYNHLARLLYVQAYGGAPADLAEVRMYVDYWRQEFYLDGPMDVDWIFGNELISRREERLYVDLVEDEDGNRRWAGPGPLSAMMDEPFTLPWGSSTAVQLVESMTRIGLLTEAGLNATRRVWDKVVVNDQMRWSELKQFNISVVAELQKSGLDLSDPSLLKAARDVVEHWIFPMGTLNLKLAKAEVKDLQAQRDRRLAQEAGIDPESYDNM